MALKTQKEYFKEIIALANDNGRSDLVEFCNGRIELLAKKNSSRGETKVQKENKVIKENLLNVITNEPMSATEITSAYNVQNGTDYSLNKISALLTQLVDNNQVVRNYEKGKASFILA